ncbi:hypothetical protein FE257_011611 [Aspergillus nanangensis]|uniref:Phosphatidic acid phosphatase type 2/haloperoxidase domain-containing protein n=1 Tax=Aspergillus nanangensis TaxID=2582783 RepID=A0AAD4GZ11_ASPNN|nr:hypothetical protein FE257_011611 [Aspergillus nanangensis]
MPRNGMAAGSSIPQPAQTGLSGALVRFYLRSFPAVDYIALGCIVAGWILIQLFVTPFHRMFSLDSKANQYPFAVVERVTVVWSIIYAGVVPFLIILLWAVTFRPTRYKVQVTLLGFLVAIMLTSLITDIIKNAVGRPRPDLISRCLPKKGTPEYSLIPWTVCTQTNQHILQEGWRSFPSGHSSFSFAGLGYLSFFSSGQMHVYRPRTDLCRFLVALIPFLCALLIAISRLEDYRHDVYDVTCGSVLGLLVAYFSYRRYYPSLQSAACDTPYDRTEAGVDGFSKLPGDEEQGRGFGPRDWRPDEETFQLQEVGPPRER